MQTPKRNIDCCGLVQADSQTGDALQRMVGSSAFRFAVLTAMALGSVWAVQLSAPDNTELGQMLEVI